MSVKFQEVNFQDLEELYEFLPPGERNLVRYLREMIIDTIPLVKEKLSWNVPFFSRRNTICFLWPASVPWGKVRNHGAVRLGFAKGYMMRDELGYLEKEGRRQVYCHDFSSPKDIDEAVLRTYLMEALRIDEEHFLLRKAAIQE